jgi:hypothetical protein
MTRKDFQLIADAIRMSAINQSAREEITRQIGYRLAEDNPRFRMGQFAEACGAVRGPRQLKPPTMEGGA